MNSSEFNLLQNVSPDDVQLLPFPHLLVDEPLSASTYRTLVESFPDHALFSNGRNRYKLGGSKPNFRYQLSAKDMYASLDSNHPWVVYGKENSNKAFYDKLVYVFESALNAEYPEHAHKLKSAAKIGTFTIDNIQDYEALLQTTPDINSLPDQEGTIVRGPHLDQPDKLFFGLYYMKPANEPASAGGDLVLYEHKDIKQTVFENHYRKIDSKYLAINKIVDYKANRLIIGLNTLRSIHSVSPRSPAASIRLFSNIVVQVPYNIF